MSRAMTNKAPSARLRLKAAEVCEGFQSMIKRSVPLPGDADTGVQIVELGRPEGNLLVFILYRLTMN